MSLELDERQRAMLSEMGVTLFERARGPADAPVVARAEPSATAPVASPRPAARAAPAPAREFEPAFAAAPASASAPALSPGANGVEIMAWEELEQAVASCRACGLCEGRKNTVFGVGHRKADWLVVGEAPGENEDLQGEPFVGQAGKLLDNMLKAIGLNRRDSVYIANVLKCRPPNNRNPEPQEVAQCEPFLRRQVALLEPKIILAMGRFAVQTLLGSTEPIGRLRGQVHRYEGVPVVVTYHPAYLLRSLPEKSKAWADMCLAMRVMRGEG